MANTNIRDLTIEQRVTRIQEYAKLGDNGHTARMELMEADHNGWMRGFNERGVMALAELKRLCIGYFAIGVGVGALLIVFAARFN